ncbi:hypothetical protein AVEN_78671-1 [Araneus ventricosus]|uniref:Uncharacterized protein n=1 Tax=Araneus ventricosus TaxID=182803 RepID=A0A4Y2W4A9_ARAVE|nr:hypothetical protein AVEN_78671-1 [Araneus ventricosus]
MKSVSDSHIAQNSSNSAKNQPTTKRKTRRSSRQLSACPTKSQSGISSGCHYKTFITFPGYPIALLAVLITELVSFLEGIHNRLLTLAALSTSTRVLNSGPEQLIPRAMSKPNTVGTD